jgi:OB-fold nucleic acid binding domain
MVDSQKKKEKEKPSEEEIARRKAEKEKEKNALAGLTEEEKKQLKEKKKKEELQQKEKEKEEKKKKGDEGKAKKDQKESTEEKEEKLRLEMVSNLNQKVSLQDNIKVVSGGVNNEETGRLLSNLNIEEKKTPDVYKNPLKITSCGGRIKVNALLTLDNKWFDQVVVVGGWIKTIRLQGNGSFCFLELNDGSSIKNLQVIIDKVIPEFLFLISQSIGASVSIKGKIIKSPGKGQNIEMQVIDPVNHYCKVVGPCNPKEYKLFKGKDQISLEVNFNKIRD